jgi:glycosyltransferase involved in cell wall biosynthesis
LFFSIIIPTYNRSSSLKRCLTSLVNQKFSDFEVIVCDDGSTDDTQNVITDFKDVLNIKYLFDVNWGGPARPRNRGLAEAIGKWICFLDSDDWYHSDRLLLLSKYVSSSFDIYYHKLIAVNSKGDEGQIRTWQINNKNAGLDLLTGFNGILTSSTCINRESLVRQQARFSENKEIVGLEDFDLWVRLGFLGLKFKFIDIELGYYSVGGDDHVSFTDKRQIDRFAALYMSYQHLLKPIQKKQSMAAFHYQKACLLSQGGDKKNARLGFLFAVKYGVVKVKLRSVYKLFRFYV